MNFGQQIKWIDGNNKIHFGTVVANHGNNVWGVSHIMNPDQTTHPEFTVAMQGGQWRTMGGGGGATQDIKAGQFFYTNQAMRTSGRYAPSAVPTGQPVGLGSLLYKESLRKLQTGVVK